MPSTKKILSELSVDELVDIISRAVIKAVNRVLEEYLGDIVALNSPNYIKSIEISRKEYEEEKYVRLEEIEDEL